MRTATVLMSCALAAAAPAHAGALAGETLPPASDVVALFEFDGSALDSSGNGRHAELIGGSFGQGRYGNVLRVRYLPEEGDVVAPMGIDWSAHADLLVHPYTVEMVFTSYTEGGEPTSGYQKLFSPDDAEDNGWYIVDGDFEAYPTAFYLGDERIRHDQVIYLAIVSTSEDEIEVFFNGQSIGTSGKGFFGTPLQAIFFQDDAQTTRGEQLQADVEVLRISDVARNAGEIAAIAERFPFFRSGFEPTGL